jgi:hypothetical protein
MSNFLLAQGASGDGFNILQSLPDRDVSMSGHDRRETP